MYFKGQTLRSLDAKGRVILSPEFRDVLLARCREGGMVLTTYDECIAGFPQPDWDELEEQIIRLNASAREVRDLQRLLIGGAETAVVDKQGRVQLTQAHREFAGLTKDLTLVGMGKRFEIWDSERFRACRSKNFDPVYGMLAQNGVSLFT